MNRFRKAISVGVTATLLASLMATVAAPAAFASLGSGGGGTIVPNLSDSAAFTLTFAEDSEGDFNTGAGSFSFAVEVLDNAGDNDINWVVSSVPTITRNLGVGACTAGFADNDADTFIDLVVTCSDMDDTKIDSFTLGNLKVEAQDDAAQGAVIFSVINDGLNLPEGLVPASGIVATAAIVGGTTTTFAVTMDDGSPDFQVTGADCDSATVLEAGQVTVAAAGVVAAETFNAVTPTDGTQVSKTTPLTGSKAIGTAVTQSVCATRFPSPVTVGDAVNVFNQNDDFPAFQAGTNSQNPGDIEAALGFFDDLLLANDIVTFTLATSGVLFSPDSELTDDIFGCEFTIPNSSIVLSADRKSITVKIPEDTEGGIDCIDFGPHVDIALGVANGTAININVSVSRAGVTVLGNPVTVGFVGFVVAGSTAAPIVLIGQNDQSTGMITLVESAAGAMGDTNPTDNDLIEICLQSNNEDWSFGRYFWAVVTAGDLKLNIAGLPVSQGKLTINGDCLEINIYTESTVASTVEIRDGSSTAPAASGSLNGPKVNVSNTALPGPVYVDVDVEGNTVGDNIIIAVRAYTGTPTAAALSQIGVTRGAISQPVGNITVSEGAPNQFQDYEVRLCLVDPSGSFTGAFLWSNPVGANAPIVSTNSTVSGLIALFDPVESTGECLSFFVDNTSIGGLGVMTVSNLKIDVKSDAPLGAVFVRVFAGNDEGTFQGALVSTISPAKVGTGIAGTAATRLGVTQIGAFTTSTKVQTVGRYVTYRFDFGVAAAGKTFQIWGATKTGNDWSAFTVVTARVANASGVVYYYIRQNSATWKSYRAFWSGGGVWTPARQARWIS